MQQRIGLAVVSVAVVAVIAVPQTSAILRILRRTKTPATFFVVGSMIPGSEGTIRKIVRQGHVIGNHTQDHSPMGDLGVAEQITQLSEQTALMEGVGGPEQRLFRPPYRSFDVSTIEMLAERDLLILEAPLLEQMNRAAGLEATGEIRGGTGFMAALEISAGVLEKDPGAPVKLAMLMRERGVLVRPLGRGVAVSPPLTMQPEQLETIGDTLVESVGLLA